MNPSYYRSQSEWMNLCRGKPLSEESDPKQGLCIWFLPPGRKTISESLLLHRWSSEYENSGTTLTKIRSCFHWFPYFRLESSRDPTSTDSIWWRCFLSKGNSQYPFPPWSELRRIWCSTVLFHLIASRVQCLEGLMKLFRTIRSPIPRNATPGQEGRDY